MPGPAGHNAVVLFFSMNRYMSVGGCRKSLPADIPKPSSCFCTERRQSRNIDSVTQRGHKQRVKQRRHENVIMKEKGRARWIITWGSRVGFCFWCHSYFHCCVTHVIVSFIPHWVSRTGNKMIQQMLKGFNSEIHHKNVLTCSEWLSKVVC